MLLIAGSPARRRAATRSRPPSTDGTMPRGMNSSARISSAPYVAYCMIGPAVGGSPGWLLTVLSTCRSAETSTAPTTPPHTVPSPPTTAMMT